MGKTTFQKSDKSNIENFNIKEISQNHKIVEVGKMSGFVLKLKKLRNNKKS